MVNHDNFCLLFGNNERVEAKVNSHNELCILIQRMTLRNYDSLYKSMELSSKFGSSLFGSNGFDTIGINEKYDNDDTDEYPEDFVITLKDQYILDLSFSGAKVIDKCDVDIINPKYLKTNLYELNDDSMSVTFPALVSIQSIDSFDRCSLIKEITIELIPVNTTTPKILGYKIEGIHYDSKI